MAKFICSITFAYYCCTRFFFKIPILKVKKMSSELKVFIYSKPVCGEAVKASIPDMGPDNIETSNIWTVPERPVYLPHESVRMKLFLIVLSSVCVQNFLSSKYELYLWSRQPSFIKYQIFFEAISCFKWQKELSQVLSQESNILKKRCSQITRMTLSKRTHYVHFPSIFLFLGSTGVALHYSELKIIYLTGITSPFIMSTNHWNNIYGKNVTGSSAH